MSQRFRYIRKAGLVILLAAVLAVSNTGIALVGNATPQEIWDVQSTEPGVLEEPDNNELPVDLPDEILLYSLTDESQPEEEGVLPDTDSNDGNFSSEAFDEGENEYLQGELSGTEEITPIEDDAEDGSSQNDTHTANDNNTAETDETEQDNSAEQWEESDDSSLGTEAQDENQDEENQEDIDPDESHDEEDDDLTDDEEPEEMAVDALGIVPTGIGGPGVRNLESIDDLGDWLHYNGLIFGDMTAYQADSEGAVAVGGNIHLGISGGYDVGGSYNYSPYTQLGQYQNPDNRFPTLLMGGQSINLGSGSGTNSHSFNIYGGPIALSQHLYDIHETLATKLSFYPELQNGFVTNIYHDWVIADQSQLDQWFTTQWNTVTRASELYANANDNSISLDYFAKEKSSGTYHYIADADAQTVNPYQNKRLTNSSGEVDEKILVITVETDADVWFSDPWTSYALPVSAQWSQSYELVIFSFPDAVNIQMTGDPQQIVNGLGADKTRPDQYVTTAQAAERHAICENVIYNFPNASQISMTGVYLMGSVIAPYASLEANGGSINGQLICQNFVTKGSMELHALQLNRYVREINPPTDEDETGSISIIKYEYSDGSTQNTLSGAEFVLIREADGFYYDGNGNFVSSLESAAVYTSDSTDAIMIDGIPFGSYILREISPPEGYLLNLDNPDNDLTYQDYPVELHKSETVAVTRYNQKQMLDLYFRKVNSNDHDDVLEGAEFTLFLVEESGYVMLRQGIVSDVEGNLSITNLEPGNYQLQEVSPPDGFTPGNPILFRVYEENGVLSIYIDGIAGGDGSEGNPYIVENERGIPDNSIYIYKYIRNPQDPSDTETPLQGAAFDLFREESAESNQWVKVTQNNALEPVSIDITTDSAGLYILSSMHPGRYRLVETAAPEGYYLSNPYPDDSLTASFPDGYIHEFYVTSDRLYQMESIPNSAKSLRLLVKKVADVGGVSTSLSGATFRLSRRDRESDNWVTVDGNKQTGTDGTLFYSGLTDGLYRLEEISAPAGYILLEQAVLIQISFPEDPNDTVVIDLEFGEGEEALPIEEDTSPVSGILSLEDGVLTLSLSVENKPHTRDLAVYKIDRDIFQAGIDEDENRAYQITYLEGAVFQLQRRLDTSSTSWADYGSRFASEAVYRIDEAGDPILGTDGNPLPVTDDYGNPKTKAVLEGLIPGTYRIVEVEFPEGYKADSGSLPVTLDNNDQGYVVYTFTVTDSMAEAGGTSEYTISNLKDSPRSDLLIYKQDSDDAPLPYVPFKLWSITKGAESWEGTMTLEEVMANFSDLEFIKYSSGASSSFYTDGNGLLRLEGVEPGIYVLFEHWNENGTDYLEDILYLLSHETTVAEPSDSSFYYHLTVFKVVEVDSNDPQQGVRIQWVDRNKTWNGEAIFDNAANNVDGDSWVQPENPEDYRSLMVVNKKLQTVNLLLRKLDARYANIGLNGAQFTLYEKVDFTADNGNLDAYQPVTTVTSSILGTVLINGLGASWKNPDGSAVLEGYRVGANQTFCAEYMLVETAPPEGFAATSDPIYFRLQLNELSKMLDLYVQDAQGNTTAYSPGYTEPSFDPDTKEVLDLDENGKPVTQGTFNTNFYLPNVYNEKALTFRFRKVSNLEGNPLSGAAFSLYYCGETHIHNVSVDAANCWTVVQTAVSEDDGLIVFPALITGDYLLVETHPPNGYRLPEGQWLITVDADAETAVIQSFGETRPPAFAAVGNRDSEADYWLLNLPEHHLPITGEKGVWQYPALGTLLLCAAALVWHYTAKIKKQAISEL